MWSTVNPCRVQEGILHRKRRLRVEIWKSPGKECEINWKKLKSSISGVLTAVILGKAKDTLDLRDAVSDGSGRFWLLLCSCVSFRGKHCFQGCSKPIIPIAWQMSVFQILFSFLAENIFAAEFLPCPRWCIPLFPGQQQLGPSQYGGFALQWQNPSGEHQMESQECSV